MLRMNPDDGQIYSLAFSPDSSTIASGTSCGNIKLWEAGTNTLKATMSFPLRRVRPVRSVAFSADGRFLAAQSYNAVALWKLATARMILKWEGDCVAFSPAGPMLAIGQSRFAEPEPPKSEVHIWNVHSHEKLSSLTLDSSDPRGFTPRVVAWSPDGKTFAVGTAGGLYLCGFTSTPLEQGNVGSIAWAPDGRTFVAGVGSEIELWNLAEGRKVKVLAGHRNPVRSLAFSADGRTVFSASRDTGVCEWHLQSGVQKTTWSWDVGEIRCVAIAPSGMLAACGGTRRAFVVWDLA